MTYFRTFINKIKNIIEMAKNVYYQTDELPIDFYGSEDIEKDETVDDGLNKKMFPMQLVSLLPPIVEKSFHMIYIMSKNNGKCFFKSDTPNNLFRMSQDDFDVALQTLIDNGFVDVTRSGESSYECVINYDKLNEFVFPFKDLPSKESIKLSTNVTFRNVNDNISIDELTDDQVRELVERILATRKKK